MEGLAGVDDVENHVGVEFFHAHFDGGEVSGAVEGGAVGLEEHEGRDFCLVVRPVDGHDEGTFAFVGVTTGFQLFDHFGNVGVGVTFTQPEVKLDVEVVVIALEGRDGNVDEVLPEGAITGPPFLQFFGGLAGGFHRLGIFFAAGGDGRVHFLQIGHGDGGFVGVGAGIVRVEVREVGVAAADFDDEHAHLQPPVAEVDVADDVVAAEAEESLEAFADDAGAQVADVHGLGDVGPAVIEHDAPGVVDGGDAETVIAGHLVDVLGEEGISEADVDEAGAGEVDAGEGIGLRFGIEGVEDGLGNLARVLTIFAGGGESAVALEVAEIGPAGGHDFAIDAVVAGGGESGGEDGG